jgi:hypothetical protein
MAAQPFRLALLNYEGGKKGDIFTAGKAKEGTMMKVLGTVWKALELRFDACEKVETQKFFARLFDCDQATLCCMPFRCDSVRLAG